VKRNVSLVTPDDGLRAIEAPRDGRLLERAETVLWTIAPPGIVLHNYVSRRFLELDAVGYRAWAFLDGARCVDDVIARCCDTATSPGAASQPETIRQLIETLYANGFIVPRADV
jgi:hypothetical protein